jgi:selenocysteine lyase/cysteine desulfurase
VRVLPAGTNPCAIVTAAIDGRDARELVSALRERRVNTAATLRWYGLLDFEKTDVTSALRLSPHYYNTEAELDEAVSILAEVVARAPRVAHA